MAAFMQKHPIFGKKYQYSVFLLLLVLESWFTYQNVRNTNISIDCNGKFFPKSDRKKIITKKPGFFWAKNVIFIIFLLFTPSNVLTYSMMANDS